MAIRLLKNWWWNNTTALSTGGTVLLFIPMAVALCFASEGRFHTGFIDSIGKNFIVIDDCQFVLSADTVYYQKNGQLADKTAMQVGFKVEYQEDDNGNVLNARLVSDSRTRTPAVLMLEQEEQDTAAGEKKGSNTIKLDGGVWRN